MNLTVTNQDKNFINLSSSEPQKINDSGIVSIKISLQFDSKMMIYDSHGSALR